MTPGSAAVFSAREVVAAGEAFRPWGREFHDPGVALDELTSLEPREPTVLRVAVGAGRPRSGPWARVVGDWLLEPGEAPRRLPRPSWEYDAEARGWSTAREWPEAWEPCEDARWMLHAAASVGVDRRLVVLAACACARTSLRYVPEGEARPLRAIETAEAWARGKATAGQVRTARAAAAELSGNRVKRRIGVRADRPNGGQTDDHDQGQHHGVFNSGGAIFRLEETLHLQSERLHRFLQLAQSSTANSPRQPRRRRDK